MNLSRLIQIIKEEVQNWFDDEPSLADKYYEKNLGIQQSQPEEIQGQPIGYVDKMWTTKLEKPVPVYKNPKSLIGFENNVRAILLSNGDLYVAKTLQGMHYDMLELLAKHGIIPLRSVVVNYGQTLPEEYITVVREGSNNEFSQSSAYDYFPEYYVEMFDMANNSQPYTFTELSLN